MFRDAPMNQGSLSQPSSSSLYLANWLPCYKFMKWVWVKNGYPKGPFMACPGEWNQGLKSWFGGRTLTHSQMDVFEEKTALFAQVPFLVSRQTRQDKCARVSASQKGSPPVGFADTTLASADPASTGREVYQLCVNRTCWLGMPTSLGARKAKNEINPFNQGSYFLDKPRKVCLVFLLRCEVVRCFWWAWVLCF